MSPTPTEVHYYWRPGCMFCMAVRRGLDKIGIATVDHNIWDNPDDAAIVRAHADGNETVPTVVIGGVAMVNPSARDVADHLAEHAPGLLPDGYDPDDRGLIDRMLGR